MTNWLNHILFKKNHIEQLQYKQKKNINYSKLNYVNNSVPQMPQCNYFKNSNIAITKNNRFSYVPAHTHSFVELNYMYSGNCTQYIDGEKIVLKTHNLIMMDKEIVQQIEYTGENDILINILIKDDSVLNQLFEYIPVSSNKITQFLYNASKINTLHNNFILFDLSHQTVAINLVESLIIKGLNSDHLQTKSLNLILSALLIELSQSIEQEYINFTNTDNDRLFPIIQYINNNFQNISLKEISQKFGYNTNYLGNQIKSTTGKTFKELVDQRRLSVSQNLMFKTDFSIEKICSLVGYQNSSSLFRLFKKYLQTTPSAYKKRLNM